MLLAFGAEDLPAPAAPVSPGFEAFVQYIVQCCQENSDQWHHEQGDIRQAPGESSLCFCLGIFPDICRWQAFIDHKPVGIPAVDIPES